MPAAKRARIGEPATKAECAPLFKILAATGAGGGLTTDCRSMLQSMAPYALQTSKEERHSFQTKLIDAIASLLNEEKAKHNDLVEAAEASLSAQCAEVEKALAELEGAREVIQGNMRTKEDRQGEADTACSATKAAEAVLADVRQRKSQLAAKQAEQKNEAAEFTQLVAGPYAQLKEGTFPRGDWRERNKRVDTATKLLSKTLCGETLCMTLSTVLKTKVTDRGEFAHQALAHADAAFNKYITSLDTVVAGHGEEMLQLESEETAADEVLRGKKVEQETAESALMAADTTWSQSTQVELDKKDIVDDSKYTKDDLSKGLDKAKGACSSFLATVEQFQHLRDRSLQAEKVEASPQVTDNTEMVVE